MDELMFWACLYIAWSYFYSSNFLLLLPSWTLWTWSRGIHSSILKSLFVLSCESTMQLSYVVHSFRDQWCTLADSLKYRCKYNSSSQPIMAQLNCNIISIQWRPATAPGLQPGVQSFSRFLNSTMPCYRLLSNSFKHRVNDMKVSFTWFEVPMRYSLDLNTHTCTCLLQWSSLLQSEDCSLSFSSRIVRPRWTHMLYKTLHMEFLMGYHFTSK